MPNNTIAAWTAPEGSYPPYFNATREGDEVVVTVRAAPSVSEGVYVCANPRDAGPGRCVPGGATCNNYCNMAPEKGPMQDSPLPCTHVVEGKSASVRVPLQVWEQMTGGQAATGEQ